MYLVNAFLAWIKQIFRYLRHCYNLGNNFCQHILQRSWIFSLGIQFICNYKKCVCNLLQCWTDTPLWRNGPPSKLVLCKACGSRWRARGTLNAYVPKHAMIYEDYYHSGSGSSNEAGNKNNQNFIYLLF